MLKGVIETEYNLWTDEVVPVNVINVKTDGGSRKKQVSFLLIARICAHSIRFSYGHLYNYVNTHSN